MRGHTRRAVDLRTRVELSPRYSPAPTDAGCVGPADALPHRGPCEPRSARAGLRAARSTCVEDADHGPKRTSKARRALLTMSRVPYSVSLRAPGSPTRWAARPGAPRGSSGRPRPVQDAASRKATPRIGPRCLRSLRNPYGTERLLPRARPSRVSVTPPRVEALLWSSHAFVALVRCPSLTRRASQDGPAGRVCKGPKPRRNDRTAASVMTSTTNQLALNCAPNPFGLPLLPLSLVRPGCGEFNATNPLSSSQSGVFFG